MVRRDDLACPRGKESSSVTFGMLAFGILAVDIGDDLVSPRWEESS